jgi:hypothetical protein
MAIRGRVAAGRIPIVFSAAIVANRWGCEALPVSAKGEGTRAATAGARPRVKRVRLCSTWARLAITVDELEGEWPYRRAG